MAKAKQQPKGLSAEEILGATHDFEVQKVDVPEWGGCVFVREMSEKDYTDWINESRKIADAGDEEELEGKPSTSAVGLLWRTMCDEDGALLFTLEQVEQIRDKSLRVLNRISDAALNVNGLKVKDEEELVGKLKESDSTTD